MVQTVNVSECPTAVVHEHVPMTALPEFFSRALTEVAAEMGRQGLRPGGPPFALYRGRPTDVVDVEAGFPVSRPIETAGAVTASRLPGGPAMQTLHVGPYDRVGSTYQVLAEAIGAAGHRPADLMWESYLTAPGADPERNQTLVTWPFTD